MKRYAVVIERAFNSYSAYMPDLPGCVTTGATIEEVERAIRQAIEFHIAGLRDAGGPVPEPTSELTYVRPAVRHLSRGGRTR